MSRSSLRQRLRAHYTREHLPERKRDSLYALLTAEPSRPRRSRWRALHVWAIAAGVLVVAALAYLATVGVLKPANGRNAPTALQIAREVAANHARGLEPEFRGADYTTLRREMSKLDFSIIEPAGFVGDGLRLVGARYCFVQCEVAAQIRLEDARSESHTLYEVADHGHFAHIEPTEISVGGVRVRIWREEGLLLCLASPSG